MGPKSLFGVPQAKGVWLFCTPMLSQSRIKQERILSVVSPWQLLWTRCGRFTSLPTGWNAQRRQHHMGDGWKAPYCLGLSVLSQLPVAACQPWNYVCMVNVYPQLPNSDRPQWHGKPLRSLRKPHGPTILLDSSDGHAPFAEDCPCWNQRLHATVCLGSELRGCVV